MTILALETPNASTGPQRLVWSLQILAAVILAQTLFFKFTAAPESVHIFETLGVEPWGRVASGVAELFAVGLLISPFAVYGALLAIGVMLGAVGSHLTLLGIEVAGDGGTLFALALVTLAASSGVVWIRRGQLPFRVPFLRG